MDTAPPPPPSSTFPDPQVHISENRVPGRFVGVNSECALIDCHGDFLFVKSSLQQFCHFSSVQQQQQQQQRMMSFPTDD